MTLVSSAWDVLTAGAVFLIGVLVALLLRRTFEVSARRALLLFLWHTVFCVAYAVWTLGGTVDALMYYLASSAGPDEFRLGTLGVVYVASFFTAFLGLSLLGTFLAFGIFGFIGLLAFDSALRHAVSQKSRLVRSCATIVVFLPSVSFWSAALGKEPIAFLAAGLAVWAAVDFKRRIPAYVIAVFAMLLVRPHMAGFLVVSLGIAMMVRKKTTLGQRFLIGGAACAGAAVLIPFAMQYVGLDSDAGVSQVTQYVEQRQEYNLKGGGAVDISSMSLPMQLFTYTFRPLPYEAFSISSLAASLDNVALLLVFIFGVRGYFRRTLSPVKVDRAFLWAYGLSSWLILAMTTANLGISVRQKWMFLPMLLFVMFTYIGKNKISTNAASTVSVSPPTRK